MGNFRRVYPNWGDREYHERYRPFFVSERRGNALLARYVQAKHDAVDAFRRREAERGATAQDRRLAAEARDEEDLGMRLLFSGHILHAGTGPI
jgi:hypothetical protein